MTLMESLEEYALDRGVTVYHDMPLDTGSYSVCVNGKCAVAVTACPLTSAEKAVCLAHELGHCETGSFYNQYNIYDLWGRHEYRANKWAIKRCIPKHDLMAAVRAGYTEPWELADIFDVTEAFIKKALFFYQNGYIA